MKPSRSFASALALVLLLWSPAVYAIPEWSFDLLPIGGDIAEPAGSTIGWGYTITNPDLVNWLSLTGISADAFLNGTPDGSIFDFPVVAPGDTTNIPYDGVSGLYQLTWDLSAQVGFVNSGTFTLSAEWYDGDPLGGGNFLEAAPDRSAAYSATVTHIGPTPVPEPSTWLLLASGLAGLGALQGVIRKKFGSNP